MLRKSLLAAALAGSLALVSAAPAQAAPTVGGGCRLSANWYVNMSATWYGNDLAYTVITSPGPLLYGNAASVDTEAISWLAGSPQYFEKFWRVGGGTNPYTYRADFDADPRADIAGVRAEAPSGITCYDEMRHP